MSDHIVQAAACLRSGDHRGAAAALRELELCDATRAFHVAAEALSAPCSSGDDVYVRFVALKVVTFALTRCVHARKEQSSTSVPFLMDYGYRLAEQVEAHAWLPVASELATAVAVALKLGCVDDSLEVHVEEVGMLWTGLMSLAGADGPPHKAFLHRVICQSTVEEFGLFSGPSRYRGLPVRVHRRCRELFSADGRLPALIQRLLVSLAAPSPESVTSVDRGLAVLISCFAWPSHEFFEEDSSVEEACGVFYVAHAEWDRLLVGAMSLPSGEPVTLHGVLREWYGSGAVNGVPADRQKLVELVQLLCAFKGSSWGEETSLQFVAASLSLCLDVFEHLTAYATERDLHLFPLLANAILRLVANFVEYFFFPQAQPLITRLAALTCFLIRRDGAGGDDPDVMSCVDEMLSVWYHLTSYIDRSSFSSNGTRTRAQRHLISEGCYEIFATYLETKVSVNAVELEDDYFSESFTNSHLHLVAQVGRICASRTCELLIASSHSLREALAAALSPASGGGPVPSALFEALWTLLKIVGFFIADPVEGEQPYIPRCFLEMGAEHNALLLQLVTEVNALHALLHSPVASSSAVQAASLDILTHYIRTYVEGEETCPLYASAFDSGAEVVGLALAAATGTLQTSPFEADASLAVCRLLDCIADKSGYVRSFCLSQTAFEQLTQAAQQVTRFRFHGHTRGRIIAFLLTCTPEAGAVPGRLREFTLSPSSSDDVNLVLEILSSLAGVFESLHSQQMIRSVFPGLLVVGQQLISVSEAKFYEREIALESVQFVRSMFVACAPLLEDDHIRALLSLVVAELRYAVRALRTTAMWASATSSEGESDRADFIVSIAKLLSSVAQWKSLDCFLPDEDTRELATSTVETAGELLRHMDERSLSLPSVEDGLFNSLELCAESFTGDFVFSSCTDAFHSAMLYALNSERVNIQRAGISITACVAAFLESATPQQNHATVCADLLKVVLRALTSGKVFFNNVRQISRALLVLTRGVPPEALFPTLSGISSEVPHSGPFLESIFPALQSATSQRTANESQFEELVQDALSSVRGTSIIGA